MSQPDVLLIDGLNLVFRNQYKLGHLSRQSDGVPSGALFGSLRSILKIVNDYKPDECVICWDGQNNRRLIDKNYKANRSSEDRSDLYNQISALEVLLSYLGIFQWRDGDQEADDLIAEFTYHYTTAGHSVLIVSEDHDFMQLLSKDVEILKPMKNNIVTEQDFIDGHDGIPAWRYPEIMAMTGCATDGVPGIKGIGERTAVKYLNKHGSFHQALYHEPKLSQNFDRIMLNYQLVKLNGARIGMSAQRAIAIDMKTLPEKVRHIKYTKDMLEQWEMNRVIQSLEAREWRLK